MAALVAFLWAPAPEASKENEVLTVMCARFNATGAQTMQFLSKHSGLNDGGQIIDQRKWDLTSESNRAVIKTLREMRDMFCVTASP